MKNRTIVGVICMVLAVVMTFAVAPLVNKLTSDTTEVLRLNTDVKQGSQITVEQLETVKVKKDIIFFDWIANGITGTADHVGIVEKV